MTEGIRRGTRLGVDVGTVRIGVARCDADAVLTLPVETIRRTDDGSDIERIAEIANQYDAIEVVVGLPKHLRGAEGISAKGARRFARRIAQVLPDLRVCLVDERMSSNQAHRRLQESGVSTRNRRDIVDQVAAQVILEQAIDEERLGHHLPGILVESVTKENDH